MWSDNVVDACQHGFSLWRLHPCWYVGKNLIQLRSHKCKTRPDPTQRFCVVFHYFTCGCLHVYVFLCWISCISICCVLQRDLLLHVDWRGRQQEVRVLQTPAGKSLLNFASCSLPAEPCLLWQSFFFLCEHVIQFSCGAIGVLHDHSLWQQEIHHINK